MSATTHESAGRRRRRRQRLRRTAVVATLLLVAAGAVGYAAWHDDEHSPGPSEVQAAAAGSRNPAAKQPAPKQPAPKQTTSARDGQPSTAPGFARVITDSIPAPTTSLALSAAVPGTTNMQPGAAAAVKAAFGAARAEGLAPEIRSAWRSAEWQQILFDRAVRTYGTAAEASTWVLPPEQSAHVKGYAVDVRPQAAAAWLEEHGAEYGLCRTYDNEWWHFEYLATATCPPRRPTATG